MVHDNTTTEMEEKDSNQREPIEVPDYNNDCSDPDFVDDTVPRKTRNETLLCRSKTDSALRHTPGSSRVMTRRDSRNLPRSTAIPHPWENANNKSHSMPPDVEKKRPTSSTV